jgi:hypothetical protein
MTFPSLHLVVRKAVPPKNSLSGFLILLLYFYHQYKIILKTLQKSMKKFLPVAIIMLLECQIIYNQTINPSVNPIAEIFTDFHLNLNDTLATTGFGLNRAYLGLNFIPEVNHFSSTIILNIGKPEDLAPGSEPRRYTFIREASISYSTEKLKVNFGITGTRLFNFQQKFWGKRYIANTYQSLNGYGSVADLGISLDYQINDFVKADMTVMNGEGYTNIQLDNSLRTSAGFTITPSSDLAIRIYGDLTRVENLWQPMFIGFAGFKNNKLTVGAEVTYKSNLDLIRGHHAWGLSGTGAISVAEKTEVFARYDYSTSVIPRGETRKWNYLNDGNFVILGIQHTFNDYVKIALDYQTTNPYDPDNQNSGAVFLNVLFRFGTY